MKYTSAEAAKLLRKLNEDLTAIEVNETQSREFLAALGEDVDSVRPAYDYSATQGKIKELEERVRKVKHAINVFNTTTQVPGFDMTIDQMLVYIPQLSRKRDKLYSMKMRLPKVRENISGFGKSNAVIDYRYANYDIAKAAADYEEVSNLLSKAQTALDLVNSTETMEI